MGPHLEENFLQDGAAARAKHEPNYRARLRELQRVGSAGCQAPRHVLDPVEQQRAVRAAVVRRHKRDKLRQQHLQTEQQPIPSADVHSGEPSADADAGE